MLYFNSGFECVCNESKNYLTFDTKSEARNWLKSHGYTEIDFSGVWFEGTYNVVYYRIRKFLGLPYYGIVREHHNKREFLPTGA